MDAYTIDWSTVTARLAAAAAQDREWYEAVAADLLRPGDRVAVDMGCGGGGMAMALAAALGADGVVLGTDGSPEVLAAAAVLHPGGITWVRADLDVDLEPVRDATGGTADLVWASGSVHHAADQQAAVTALAGLLGADGRLALAEGGLPARRLPWDLGVGEPGLKVRLDAAQDRWFARMRAGLPGSVAMPYGWPEALRRAGLNGVRSTSTLIERYAPLTSDDRTRAVTDLHEQVDQIRPTGLLDPDDIATWNRLLDPAGPEFLGHRDDLHSLTARTIHIGVRPD